MSDVEVSDDRLAELATGSVRTDANEGYYMARELRARRQTPKGYDFDGMNQVGGASYIRRPAPDLNGPISEERVSILGNVDDLNSVAHALKIGGMGTPYRAYQGSLYCDYQQHRIADFQDYGLALAATVLFNNAKAIKAALEASLPDGEVQSRDGVMKEADGFRAEDFIHTASQLRSAHEAIVKAALSNNFNIILAALDRASSPQGSSAEVEGATDA